MKKSPSEKALKSVASESGVETTKSGLPSAGKVEKIKLIRGILELIFSDVENNWNSLSGSIIKKTNDSKDDVCIILNDIGRSPSRFIKIYKNQQTSQFIVCDGVEKNKGEMIPFRQSADPVSDHLIDVVLRAKKLIQEELKVAKGRKNTDKVIEFIDSALRKLEELNKEEKKLEQQKVNVESPTVPHKVAFASPDVKPSSDKKGQGQDKADSLGLSLSMSSQSLETVESSAHTVTSTYLPFTPPDSHTEHENQYNDSPNDPKIRLSFLDTGDLGERDNTEETFSKIEELRELAGKLDGYGEISFYDDNEVYTEVLVESENEEEQFKFSIKKGNDQNIEFHIPKNTFDVSPDLRKNLKEYLRIVKAAKDSETSRLKVNLYNHLNFLNDLQQEGKIDDDRLIVKENLLNGESFTLKIEDTAYQFFYKNEEEKDLFCHSGNVDLDSPKDLRDFDENLMEYIKKYSQSSPSTTPEGKKILSTGDDADKFSDENESDFTLTMKVRGGNNALHNSAFIEKINEIAKQIDGLGKIDLDDRRSINVTNGSDYYLAEFVTEEGQKIHYKIYSGKITNNDGSNIEERPLQALFYVLEGAQKKAIAQHQSDLKGHLEELIEVEASFKKFYPQQQSFCSKKEDKGKTSYELKLNGLSQTISFDGDVVVSSNNNFVNTEKLIDDEKPSNGLRIFNKNLEATIYRIKTYIPTKPNDQTEEIDQKEHLRYLKECLEELSKVEASFKKLYPQQESFCSKKGELGKTYYELKFNDKSQTISFGTGDSVSSDNDNFVDIKSSEKLSAFSNNLRNTANNIKLVLLIHNLEKLHNLEKNLYKNNEEKPTVTKAGREGKTIYEIESLNIKVERVGDKVKWSWIDNNKDDYDLTTDKINDWLSERIDNLKNVKAKASKNLNSVDISEEVTNEHKETATKSSQELLSEINKTASEFVDKGYIPFPSDEDVSIEGIKVSKSENVESKIVTIQKEVRRFLVEKNTSLDKINSLASELAGKDDLNIDGRKISITKSDGENPEFQITGDVFGTGEYTNTLVTKNFVKNSDTGDKFSLILLKELLFELSTLQPKTNSIPDKAKPNSTPVQPKTNSIPDKPKPNELHKTSTQTYDEKTKLYVTLEELKKGEVKDNKLNRAFLKILNKSELTSADKVILIKFWKENSGDPTVPEKLYLVNDTNILNYSEAAIKYAQKYVKNAANKAHIVEIKKFGAERPEHQKQVYDVVGTVLGNINEVKLSGVTKSNITKHFGEEASKAVTKDEIEEGEKSKGPSTAIIKASAISLRKKLQEKNLIPSR